MAKPYFPPNSSETWYWVLLILLSVVSFAGNGLVFYLIATRTRLQNNVNWFILSLAVADFSFSITAPVQIVESIRAKKNLTWGGKLIYDMLLETSVFNLCALTLDRYVAVSFPLKYDHFMTKRRRLSIHALAWITGLLSPVPSFIAFYTQSYYTFRILQSGFLLLCEVLPALLLLMAYLRMVCVVRTQKKSIERQAAQVAINYQITRQPHTACHRRKSSIHVVGTVVLVFDFCFSVSFYKGFVNYVLFEDVYTRWVVDVARLLYHLNSAANFLVYACMKTDIKREIKRCFDCRSRNRIGNSFISQTANVIKDPEECSSVQNEKRTHTGKVCESEV